MIPHISLICPSVRSYSWLMRMYSGIVTNLDIEIILLGPHPPTQKLPPNMKYIFTTVKRVQAAAIGVHLARGETIAFPGDDLTFSPYAWDEAYHLYKSENNYKVVVGFIYVKDDVVFNNLASKLWWVARVIPKSLVALMSKQFFNGLNGFDSNYSFIGEYDLLLRAAIHGMIMRECQVSMLYELTTKDNPNSEGSKIDEQRYFEFQWHYHQEKVFGPTIPIVPFDFNDSIYIKNQGSLSPIRRDGDIEKSRRLTPEGIENKTDEEKYRYAVEHLYTPPLNSTLTLG